MQALYDDDDARQVLIATFQEAKLTHEQLATKAAGEGRLFESREWTCCAALYRRALSHLGVGPQADLEALERTLRRDIRLPISDISMQQHTNRTRHAGREIANVIAYARRYLRQ